MLSRAAAAVLTRLSRDPSQPDRAEGVESWEGMDPLIELRRRFPDFDQRIAGKVVLDFGCGHGDQTVAMLRAGAAHVVAVDIEPAQREATRSTVANYGMSDMVTIAESIPPGVYGLVKVIVSQNAMEHFTDAEAVLTAWRKALTPDGVVLLTFGPPWYAPYGAHMHFFTPVPWVHLLFPESAVLRVRSRYRNDGATRYEDVEGGLARMSVRRFHRLVRDAGFVASDVQYDTVKGLPVTGIPIVRELLTNNIAAELRREL